MPNPFPPPADEARTECTSPAPEVAGTDGPDRLANLAGCHTILLTPRRSP